MSKYGNAIKSITKERKDYADATKDCAGDQATFRRGVIQGYTKAILTLLAFEQANEMMELGDGAASE